MGLPIRLNNRQVRAIRQIYQRGYTQAEIAEVFGTTSTTVNKAIRGLPPYHALLDDTTETDALLQEMLEEAGVEV